MSHFLNLLCKFSCIALLSSLYVIAEEPSCPHSSPEAKAALDAARRNAEQSSDKYVRSSLLHEIAKGYARNGDFKESLQVVRTDSALMWEAADVLSRNMLRCGQSTEVKTTAPTLEGRSRSLMFQWLAEWQAKHDDSAGSQESLAQIKDSDIRREAQFNIITFKAVKGDVKAQETEYRRLLSAAPSGTQSIDDQVAQDMALAFLIKGDVDAAVANLNKMRSGEKVYSLYALIQGAAENKGKVDVIALSKSTMGIVQPFLRDTSQAYPLSLVATALSRLGAFDEAIELAKGIPDQQRKTEALVMIAAQLIAAKDEGRANIVLDSLPKVPEGKPDLEGEREMAWVRIAIAEANSGDGENSLRALDKVRDPRMETLAKWQRAYASAVVGRFSEARALATQIPPSFPSDERGRALRLVAAVETRNKVSEAIDWVEHLSSPEDRASAYLGVADGQLGEPTEEIPPYFED